MALTSFVANVTKITAAWLNKIDVLYVTVFGEATTKAQARTALTSDAPMAIGEGGTGATTAGAARTALGAAASGANTDIDSIALAGLADLSDSAAGQIKFPAVPNLSADVHTLDDYEEGTWTPSLGGTATYNNQEGHYLKVGKTVFYSFYIFVNVIGTGSTYQIAGLPFTPSSSAMSCSAITDFTNIATAVAGLYATVIIGVGIEVKGTAAAGGTASRTVTAIFGNSALVWGGGFYTTTS